MEARAAVQPGRPARFPSATAGQAGAELAGPGCWEVRVSCCSLGTSELRVRGDRGADKATTHQHTASAASSQPAHLPSLLQSHSTSQRWTRGPTGNGQGCEVNRARINGPGPLSFLRNAISRTRLTGRGRCLCGGRSPKWESGHRAVLGATASTAVSSQASHFPTKFWWKSTGPGGRTGIASWLCPHQRELGHIRSQCESQSTGP